MTLRALLASAAVSIAAVSIAQSGLTGATDSMKWRCIGPFRGGRTVGASCVPGRPNWFYIGVTNGGVWRTTDAGRTWQPVFDDQPTGSIGAVAVAPSDANRIYVGSGEGLQRPDLSLGDGMYRSDDGGKSWRHLGLREGQQISGIAIDPKDKNRLFVAVLGHPYGPNDERGVYRSTNGGVTFRSVLHFDADTGAAAVEIDLTRPQIVYADMWAGRQGPWENGKWQGKRSGLFRSQDGGTTWTQLTKGLPTIEQGLGRIGFSICPSRPTRIYATVDAPEVGGIFRSDDDGKSWQRLNHEARVWGRGDDFAEVRADPKNPDVVYAANTSTYKSTDGGRTFTAWKGAPGGDDYHTVRINPEDPSIILLASDQGATITVNGGETWSSWYNQPTAQFYHVITDNQFPYSVYGGQQESGSAGVASRGPDGQITFREWHPVGVEEYGYVAPDPLNPNLIYGGKLTRFDRRSGRVEDVRPPEAKTARFLRTAPVIFSSVDPHVLYFAGNRLFRTGDGAKTWETISPDLSREQPSVPESIGIYRSPELATQRRRGVIYTVAPSKQSLEVIWAGTDDGLIHRTADGGKTWINVTPPEVDAWSKVSLIDAGSFDENTAYAAVNRIRLDDMRPHVYRTHDGGKSWKAIVDGLPNDPVNSVREDPKRRGLLFCGTERATYVSFDDGDHWESLRLNMPATSIRDVVVHENDLVVGTHGRSFWILDDLAPLRDPAFTGSMETLISPSPAYLVSWNLNTDTPLPPDEPAGKNPPDGALIDYRLAAAANSVRLEILDSTGTVIRTFDSANTPAPPVEKELEVPFYWARIPAPLRKDVGLHRFVWDMHADSPAGRKRLPMTAILRDTPLEPRGPLAKPGKYTVRLTVDGRVLTRPLTLVADPRDPNPPSAEPGAPPVDEPLAGISKRN